MPIIIDILIFYGVMVCVCVVCPRETLFLLTHTLVDVVENHCIT